MTPNDLNRMLEVFCISLEYNYFKLALIVNSIITTLHTASSTSSQNFPKTQENLYSEKNKQPCCWTFRLLLFLLFEEIGLKIKDGHHALVLLEALCNKEVILKIYYCNRSNLGFFYTYTTECFAVELL